MAACAWGCPARSHRPWLPKQCSVPRPCCWLQTNIPPCSKIGSRAPVEPRLRDCRRSKIVVFAPPSLPPSKRQRNGRASWEQASNLHRIFIPYWSKKGKSMSTVFCVIDDKHVPLYRIMWVAAVPHFCGDEKCDVEGTYEVRIEPDESLWATRDERDKCLAPLEEWVGGRGDIDKEEGEWQ